MSSSSESDGEIQKKVTASSSSDNEGSSQQESRPKKKKIESGGDSDSDDGRRKKKIVKKTVKRRRNSSDGSDDDLDDSLFVDAEDKARWKALSELEQEKEIFDRIEARDMRKAREEIAQQLEAKKEKEKKEKKDKKRKVESSGESGRSASPAKRGSGSDSEIDAEYHRPSEMSRKKSQKNAMAELKQKRRELEKKNAKNTLSIDAVFGSQSSGSSSSSSSAASSRSSSVSSRGSSPTRSDDDSHAVKKEVESLIELRKARLSRFKLLKYIHEPYFKDLVTGCFIKVGMGHESGSDSSYKLWQIEDVVEQKVYQVEEKRTNKHLKAKYGRRERVFKVAYVSNSDFTQLEFDEWLSTTKAEGTMPYVDFIEKKHKEIEKILTHSVTDEEINKKLEEKRKFQKTPRNFAVLKSDLQKKKLVAQQSGDMLSVQKLQKQIDEIDREANELDRVRCQDLSAIAWINQRNRNKIKNEILNGSVEMDIASQDDPFTRKKGVMKVVAGVKKTEAQLKEEKDAADMMKSGQGVPSSSLLPSSSTLSSTAVASSIASSASKKKPGSTAMHDLHASVGIMDFDIDLNKLLGNKTQNEPPFESPVAHRPAPATSRSTSGKSKGISLEDYRKRRAAMVNNE